MISPCSKEKIEEYLKTNKNFQHLCSAVNDFRDTFRIKDDSSLENWLDKVKSNIRELTTFAREIERDIEAVKNAIGTEFSNGVIEGVINKINVIRRIMNGNVHLNYCD